VRIGVGVVALIAMWLTPLSLTASATAPTPPYFHPELNLMVGDRLAVAACESGDLAAGVYHPQAQNSQSSASGAFQFIDATWEWVTNLPAPARDYPLLVQIWAFDRLWDDGAGAAHWEESRHCWEAQVELDE